MKNFKIALLGTGLMGYGMAANIAKAGFETLVWNRTPEKAFDLRNHGVVVAETVPDTVREADIVLTMVIDFHAVAEVMTLALPAMKKDAIWIQTSTVGIEGQTTLSSMAKDFGISFIDAPVLGSKDAADNGSLIALAAGEDLAIEQVTPVLDSFSSRIMKMGEAINDAQRLKMVMQSWALSITAATGQAFALAQNLGTSSEKFLEAIKGGAQDCPYAHVKGKAIQQEHFDPAFTLDGAVKDAGLIIDSMKLSDTGSDVMEAIQKNYLHAAKNFNGREDMGAIFKSFKTSH